MPAVLARFLPILRLKTSGELVNVSVFDQVKFALSESPWEKRLVAVA